MEDTELEVLAESEQALNQHAEDLISEWDKPLVVNSEGYIQSGVFWIDADFTRDFWSKARKKPKPVKCTRACGHKHNKKGD
jgi:hypothetical protein